MNNIHKIHERFLSILYKQKNTFVMYWTWPEYAIYIYRVQWPPNRDESQFIDGLLWQEHSEN